MNISFAKISFPRGRPLVVGALEGGRLLRTAKELDRKTRGAIKRAVRGGRFKGKNGQTLELLSPAGLSASRIVLVGLGKPAEMDVEKANAVGAAIVKALAMSGERQAAVIVDDVQDGQLSHIELLANVALGAQLAGYRFDRYRTTQKPDEKPSLGRLTLMTDDAAALRRAYSRLGSVGEGVAFARDLMNEPANVLHPDDFAKRVQSLSDLGIKVDVLSEKQMARLGMNALLGVGRGSARESKLVTMQWKGAQRSDSTPVALVGKGVCFDTGGISLKPAQGMWDMKGDMGGAAAVVGTMRALAGRNARANVVGVIGLVENMPGAEAQRPGDIVTSMSGQTIEVLNTDAEGRLVLADALTYVQEKHKPRFIIDLATLTGAIMVALGDRNAGLFSNDDELADRCIAAGASVGERVWRMPLDDHYDKKLKSKVADIANISGGPQAGAITAAQFLQRFVDNQTPWAHIDIAGVAWSSESDVPSWGTGYGVRLLDRLIADHYEEK